MPQLIIKFKCPNGHPLECRLPTSERMKWTLKELNALQFPFDCQQCGWEGVKYFAQREADSQVVD